MALAVGGDHRGEGLSAHWPLLAQQVLVFAQSR
jgi:hypothetical protein